VKTVVVNVRTDHAEIAEARAAGLYVPIHRPYQFGNPFILGRHGTREQVIRMYEDYIRKSKLMKEVPALRGKVLGCFCKPAACHGDVLARLAEESHA
jgi:hypothetical protein